MFRSKLNTLMTHSMRNRAIEPGAIYRRLEATIKETAEVVAVEPDGVGIPHVHYVGHCEAKHGNGAEYRAARILSVSAFRANFTRLH